MLFRSRTSALRKIHLKTQNVGDKVSVYVSNLPKKVPSHPTHPEQIPHFLDYVKLLEHPDIGCPIPEEDPRFSVSDKENMSVHPVKCTICTDCGP